MAGAGDHIDDLTRAYLGKGGAASGAGSSRGARLAPAGSTDALHIVIVGNVPALAGIWLAQLADQCARSAGPVGLVRLDRHAPRAELYRSDGRALPADPDAWLSRAAASAVRWLVCATSDCAPRNVIAAEAPVLLVTGTDEAALAAARRSVSGIAAEAASAGVPAPEIEVAVVGSPSETASRAFDALEQWAAADPSVTSSGIRLSLAMVAPRVERLDVAAAVMLPTFAELTPREAIERVRSAMRAGADRFMGDAPAPSRASSPSPASRAARPPAAPRAEDHEEPLEWSIDDVSPPAPLPATRPAVPVAPAPAPRRSADAAPATAHASAHAPPAAAPSHARSASAVPVPARAGALALFPEWTPLSIECPDAPDVSFAIEGGTVHLLSADTSMRTLRVAAAWIRAQWSLVAALAPGLDRARPTVCEHLMLEDPRHAIPLHRCGVLLHARVQVSVAGAVVVQRIDLNDAASAGLAGS
jgi:hypothetical protein